VMVLDCGPLLSPQFNSRPWELHDWMSTDCFGSTHADHMQSRRHLFSLYDVRMEAGQWKLAMAGGWRLAEYFNTIKFTFKRNSSSPGSRSELQRA
jgi:hypothetical protein